MTENTANSKKDFKKVIKDLVADVLTTFPELKDSMNPDLLNPDEEGLVRVYEHCRKVYPERFFDILYQNTEMFDNEDVNTMFLPDLDFKLLMNDKDVSDKTKDTLWKYLQLILLSVIKDVSGGDSFGDTAKLFEAIDESELKEKLKETVDKMHEMFENSETSEDGEKINLDNLPNPEDIHSHVTGMMDGKLGSLAREIAEETAKDLNMDMEGAENVGDVFKKLFKNPGKLMGLVQNVGGKLDEKIKSGEINESELLQEAAEIVQKMKDIPGMGDMKDLLSKMGMPGGGKNSKINMGAFQSHMDKQMKMAKMKERMKKKSQQKFDGKTYSDGVGMDKTSLEEAQKKAEAAMNALLAEEEMEAEKKSKKKKKNKKKKKKRKKDKSDNVSEISTENV
tara:strand:+ start:2296 stop:3477 length:1182 start_codon:yes stop_codon:yes gene_type:complete